MARNSGARGSSLLKLSERFNEVIALEFDLACTSRLQVYDEEREARLLEAMGMGSINRALGGSVQLKERGGPTIIEAGWQVPDA